MVGVLLRRKLISSNAQQYAEKKIEIQGVYNKVLHSR